MEIDKAKIIKNNIYPLDFWQSELPEFNQKKSSGGWLSGGECPNHGSSSGKKGSFKVRENGSYRCFNCGFAGGDIIQFVQDVYNLDFLGACNKLASIFNISFDNQKNYIYNQIITEKNVGDELRIGDIKKAVSITNCLMSYLNDKYDASIKNYLFDYAVNDCQAIRCFSNMYGTAKGKRYDKNHFLNVCRNINNINSKRLIPEFSQTDYEDLIIGDFECDYNVKFPNEILFDLEIRMGRYIIYCLKYLIKNKGK